MKYLEDEILKFAEQTKSSLKTDIESIDEDIILYRAFMIKARNEFKKVKEEQLNASYEMWDKFEEDMQGLRGYVKKATSELEPLKTELNAVATLMKQVDSYGIKDLLSLIKEINSNYYGETANMVKFLFENYKKTTHEN